jgi:hypothetical protein
VPQQGYRKPGSQFGCFPYRGHSITTRCTETGPSLARVFKASFAVGPEGNAEPPFEHFLDASFDTALNASSNALVHAKRGIDLGLLAEPEPKTSISGPFTPP